MDSSRCLLVQSSNFSGKSVVYVMSRDQRVNDNHALLHAQDIALEHKVPLYVIFVLKTVKNRSKEHYQFMIDGLTSVAKQLKRYNIEFVVRSGETCQELLAFSKEVEAGALIFDFTPLKVPRAKIKKIAKSYSGSITVVDTHNIIPVWVASDKQEFAAHTMRRKLHLQLQNYLIEPRKLSKHPVSGNKQQSLSDTTVKTIVDSMPASSIIVAAKSGKSAAMDHLKTFIQGGLSTYALARNDIANDQQSGLSPYLHFGQISSLRVALDVLDHVNSVPLLFEQVKLAQAGETPSEVDGMNALFEEMIVRKELSDNFCFYSKDYSSLAAAPSWALQTLQAHVADPRDFTYTLDQWERALTHDPAWNAAQTQLVTTGKMHGYMRMYWAKKILEWSTQPEEALEIAIYLNDKYSIDGGDPNGYVGILWSIAGLHDRPWFERPVYGKIRYMNTNGLMAKFDLQKYIAMYPGE